MRDIVERLKDSADQHPLDAPMDLFIEAATEIERLRRALLSIQKFADIEGRVRGQTSQSLTSPKTWILSRESLMTLLRPMKPALGHRRNRR